MLACDRLGCSTGANTLLLYYIIRGGCSCWAFSTTIWLLWKHGSGTTNPDALESILLVPAWDQRGLPSASPEELPSSALREEAMVLHGGMA